LIPQVYTEGVRQATLQGLRTTARKPVAIPSGL